MCFLFFDRVLYDEHGISVRSELVFLLESLAVSRRREWTSFPRSRTMGRIPCSRSVRAANIPAGPKPTTTADLPGWASGNTTGVNGGFFSPEYSLTRSCILTLLRRASMLLLSSEISPASLMPDFLIAALLMREGSEASSGDNDISISRNIRGYFREERRSVQSSGVNLQSRIVNILSIENLEKTLKDEPLFTGASLGLEEGEKVGIVGRIGTGKSTFL